jgi:retron-type reverse transcriptase
MTRNWVKVQRKHFLEQSMVRHSDNASELWKNYPGRNFGEIYSALQKRVFKAVSVGDKRKAKYLQKLILKSKAARYLAIRQVTQLNAGKKTAGVDGKASLTFEERFNLSELKQTLTHGNIISCVKFPIPKRMEQYVC